MVDLPPKERGCHRTGFEKNCRDLVVSGRCERWMTINGTNANTGEPVNGSKCIDDWIPYLMIENSAQQRQTGAAVESFRNEVMAAQGFPGGASGIYKALNGRIAPPNPQLEDKSQDD